MPRRKLQLGAKAAFVRSNPNLSAQELVSAAKKQGMALTAGHVYNIRAADKKKETGNGTQEIQRRDETQPSSKGSSTDEQLRTLVIRVGLDRAEQVLSELKSSLRAL
jgi:hypothetical protein